MFTARNAALIALGQVGVIVAGSLAMAVSYKVWTNIGVEMPFVSQFFFHSAPVLLVLPFAWICAAMGVRTNPSVSEDLKQLVFLLGTCLLVTLILFELYAILRPWLSVCFLSFGERPEFE